MQRTRHLVCAMAFAVAPVTIAMAQDGAETLPEVVVTATRIAEPVTRTGSAISVVGKETLQTNSQTSLVDALRTVPGLDITETGGPGAVSNVRLRGGNTGQTLVLVDGQRINNAADPNAAFDFAVLSPGLIDHVEVLRGPQSALYGSDAIGGVINIITKRGSGPNHGDVQVEAGRYGTVTTTASTYGALGPWSYALSGNAAQTDGFSRFGYRVATIDTGRVTLEPDGFQRFGGYGRIGYDPGEGFSLEASGFGTNTRSEFDEANLPNSPSRVRTGFYNATLAATSTTFDGHFVQTLRLQQARTRQTFNDINNPLTSSTQSDFAGDRRSVEYQGTIGLDAFGKLITGGRYQADTSQTSTQMIIPARAQIPGVSRSQITRSIFALYEVPIAERLILSAGGRYDSVRNVDDFITYRATAAYLIPESGTKFRASVGTGAKAPTLFQLYSPIYGNAALRSERSFGYDAGFDQSLIDGRAKMSVTYYQNNLTNLINFVGPVTSGTYQNVARANTNGLEYEADATLIKGLVRFKAAYTLLHTTDLATNSVLARRPVHTARLALPVTPLDGLLIEPRLTYVAQRYNSANNANPLKPYVRVDLYGAYTLTANLRTFARIENVTDVRYQEVLNYGTTARAAYAGFDVSW